MVERGAVQCCAVPVGFFFSVLLKMGNIFKPQKKQDFMMLD